MTAEVQERISAQFYLEDSTYPLGIDLKEFLNCATSSPCGPALVKSVLDFIAIDPRMPARIFGSEGNPFANQDDGRVRQFVNLAMFTVYLIDLLQDFGGTPEFEESRILLVKVLREWRDLRRNNLYLYVKGDLEGNYLSTFASSLGAVYKYSSKWKIIRNAFRGRRSQAVQTRALMHRQQAYEIRHNRKTVSVNGLTIHSPTGERSYRFDVFSAVRDLYAEFKKYQNQERLT